MISDADFVIAWKDVLEQCQLKPGEQVAILTSDDSNMQIVNCARIAIGLLGGVLTMINLPPINGEKALSLISRLGVETSSFVAILGAIGLAVGMSLQGSLSNFAGGMLIVMFKPFKVGDTIEAQGETGKVMEIHIFTTKILTAQNQIIYIPNGVLSNGKIKNYSQKNMRRSDLIVRTNYDSDIKVIKGQLETILKNHPKVLKSPAPEVFIHELTDSTVNFGLRAWVKNADYAKVSSDILEESKGVVKL